MKVKPTARKRANMPSAPSPDRPAARGGAPVAPRHGPRLEANADRAAARIVRGETGLGEGVGRTSPAARIRVPGSTGQPLPAALRATLERGFGADLSAVRIHQDARARDTVRAHGARGLAAGADVFLGIPASALAGEAGLKLLIHELAHVLQQAGRRGTDGRLRATPSYAAAEPQLAPDRFVDFMEGYDLFRGVTAWEEIKKAYATVPGIAPHVTAVETEVGTYGPISPEAIARLVATTRAPTFASLSDDVKGLYVDGLKLVGGDVAYGAARDVLIAHREVRTAFRSRAFYEFVRKASLGWMYGYAVGDDFAKAYYPWRFIATYRDFIASPGAAPGDLEPTAGAAGSKTFDDRLLKLLGTLRRAPEGKLMDNELRAAMLFALSYLDDGRREFLPRQIENRRDPGVTLVEAHAKLARDYARGEYGKLSPSPLEESIALFGAAFPRIKEDAARTSAYYDRIERIERAFGQGKGFHELSAEEVKALAFAVRDDARFKRVSGLLLRVGKAIFALSGKNLPGAGPFATRVEAQRSALAAEIARHTGRLAALIKSRAEEGDEAAKIGLALRVVASVEGVLTRYDAGRDKAAGKRADERIAARLRLARDLIRLGDLFGWSDVRKAGNDVFHEGLQLALLSDWEPDASPAEVGDLASQTGGFSDLEGTRISGGLLERYLYTDYYEKLTAALTTLLGGGAKGTEPILSQAFAEAKADRALPRRFIVRDWAWGSPTSPGITGVSVTVLRDDLKPARTFGGEVLRHPKTRAMLASELTRSGFAKGYALAPTRPLRSGRWLYVWLVPHFDAFISTIAGIDTVRDAVAKNWRDTHGAKSTPPDALADPFAWLAALEAMVLVLNTPVTADDVKSPGDSAETIAKKVATERARRKALLESIGGAISGKVEGEFDTAEKAAKAKAREAVSVQRDIIVRQGLRPALKAYDRFDNADWSVPGDVFKSIRNFVDFVWPEEDRPLHAAALALELAPDLMTAFGPHDGLLGTVRERRFDIIDAVLVLSWGAMKTWEGGSGSAVAAISSLGKSTLDANATVLGKLRDSLATQAVKEQRRHGLHVVKGGEGKGSMASVYWENEGMALIKWNMDHTDVAVGAGFSLYGTDYLLIEVHDSFIFHPGFGRGESLGVSWPEGQRPGKPLLLTESGDALKPTGRALFTLYKKPRTGAAETVVIKDDDVQNLTAFSKVLSEHFAFAYIKGAGVFIERYANLVMEVLEFLPGIGQGVAAARFAAAILQTIGSPEFKDLLAAFSEDGFGAFEKIFASIATLVQPEDLVNALIFEVDFTTETRSNPALGGKQERQKRIAGKGGPWTRIAVLLKNVVNIGRRVLDRLKALTTVAQVPVRDAQLWVLRTPAAGLILELVERGFDAVDSLSIEALAQSAEDMVDKGWQVMVKEATTDAAQGATDRARDIMDTLRQLELPEELVPVEFVVDFVIDLVVHALSAKYRKGVEAVRGILRTLGLWDQVVKAISDGLFKGGVDPNILYRKHVRAKLEPWLTAARDTFSGEVAKTFDRVPFLSAINAPKGTPVALDFTGLGFPEAEGHDAAAPHGADGANGRAAPPGMTPNGGEPLPPDTQRRAESGLGHDLGHVRLHRDGEADSVTAGFGADALTTGSHVYMRSGLNPGAGEGERILGHELAHVVQQTGPRPLGRSASQIPVPGRPGLGLRYSASREAAADRAARTLQEGRVAAGPLDLGGAPDGGGGLQPAFTKKFVQDFLSRLHEPEDIKENLEELRKGAGATTVKLAASAKAVASALGPALKGQVTRKAAYRKPFASVHAELKTFVESVWVSFEAMIPQLVDRAETTMTPPKKSGKERGRVSYLPPDHLAVHLERTLFGLTSMAFVVELNATKGPATVKGRDIVDKNKPVKSVRMVYVHLPLLGDSPDAEKLWDLLTTNTFAKDTDYSKATHDSFKEAMRLVLGRGSPDPGNYDSNAFKLGRTRATRVRNQRARMASFVDTSNAWPTPAQYVEPDATKVSGAAKKIGLRVGTFAVWKDAGVEDRDAHHSVQYLLFEYLRNAKSGKQPFPKLSAVAYPGISASGGEVDAITRGTNAVDVKRFYPGRGGAMPTIYLARHTHQSGLHYRAETPDDLSSKRSSQGSHIHNAFGRFMGPYRAVLEDEPALKQLAQKKKAGEPDVPVGSGTPKVTVNTVGKAIYTAARKTYQDMWKEMRPKLKTRLGGAEVAYYNAIAKQRGGALLTATQVGKPFARIVSDTESVVGKTFGAG